MKDIVNIVEKDTEAFARRSAITFLFNAFKMSSNVKVKLYPDLEHVISTVVKATRDFDWEVKLIALDFIALFLHLVLSECSDNSNICLKLQEPSHCSIPGYNLPEVPEYAQQLYSSSNKFDMKINIRKIHCRSTLKQVLNALTEALDDYDEKVSEKALNILTDLQKILSTNIDTFNEMTENGNHCEPVTKKRKLSETDTTAKPDNVHKCITNELQYSANTVNKLGQLDEVHCSEVDDKENVVEITESLRAIIDFDLSVYRSRYEQVHDEASKLVSLVEDIVTASDKDEEDNTADCY